MRKHSYSEIIENQNRYKVELSEWIVENYRNLKLEVDKIDSDDEFIMKEKEKMLKKIKKFDILKITSTFFFMHKKRNKKYYIFWDNYLKEAKFFTYG